MTSLAVAACTLVAFTSAEGVLLLPAWAFPLSESRLVPITAVTNVWSALPHDGLLGDVDLAAWMATRRRDLDGQTLAAWAADRGDDELLRATVRELRRPTER
ncbi:MAG: hypothetical protein ACR2H3_09265 [Acidimicrobiales bacterium]